MKFAFGAKKPWRGSFRTVFLLTVLLWTMLFLIYFIYHYLDLEQVMISKARVAAVESIEKDLVYRRWAARLGGVYVPVTDSSPPNPYLANMSERDLTTPSGRRLTLVNPAYMTRQVHNIMAENNGVRGHITSLKPLNTANEPDEFEQRALSAFKTKAVDFGEVVTVAGERHYRLVRPLFIESSCLKCHEAQGYKLGDLRGGISSDIPLSPYISILKREVNSDFGRVILLWLGGMVIIFLGAGYTRRRIEERQLAISSLAISEERFRTIVSTSLEGILTLDINGNIDFLNARMAAMLGYTEDEMLGQPLSRFVHEDEQEDLTAKLERRCAGVAEKFERRFRRKDGDLVRTISSASPRYNEHNVYIGSCGMYVDISVRKRAEEELRVSEQKFRNLFDSMEEGFALHEIICNDAGIPVDYRFLEINPAFSALTGLKKEDVIGKGVCELLVLTEDYWIDIYGRVALTGEPALVEEYSAALARWYRVVVFSPSIGQFAVLFTDITERKQSEAALASSERRYRELLENISLVAITLDVEGKVSFCNEFFLDITGWSRDEVIGQEWFSRFIPSEMMEKASAAFNNGIVSGSVRGHMETQIVASDGKLLTIVWDHTMLHHADGSIAGVAAIGADVTEKKLLEEQLRHSQKMEAIGQLAGGVAHDFNNLLQVITTYGYLLQNLLKENGLPLQLLEEQLLAVRRAVELTGALLAFSRKQTMNKKETELNHIVLEARKLLNRVIGEHIVFEVSTSQGELFLLADEGQIQQILMNLATNARDAMPNGGRLVIVTSMYQPDDLFAKRHGIEASGSFALIKVTDSGEGISTADLPNVFEPFYTTKEVGKGTGLGLAIVYGIVSQHGGLIEVDSVKRGGTTFSIYLPMFENRLADNRVVHKHFLGGSETILLVEDEEQVRAALRTIIAGHGYQVLEAADGEAAVELFRQNADDIVLVVLDVIMPKKSGWEALEGIREVSPEIKAIFLSGYTTDVLQQKIFESEREILLMKPVEPEKLMEKIRIMLDLGSSDD